MILHIWMLPFVVVCCSLSMSAAVKANVNSKVILQSVESLASGHQLEVSSLAHFSTNSSEPTAGQKRRQPFRPPPISDAEPNYDDVAGLSFDPSGVFGRQVDDEPDEVWPVLLEQSLKGSRRIARLDSAYDRNPTQLHKVMEDFMTVADPWISIMDEQFAFFAVFDGHGCADYSIWCQNNLHNELEKKLRELKAEAFHVKPHPDDAVAGALSKTFFDVDNELRKQARRGGTTATVALARRQKESTFLYVANVGDSNALRIYKRAKDPFQVLSGMHRAEILEDLEEELPEMKRIRAFALEKDVQVESLVYGRRLLGDVRVSRSLGDHEAKGAMEGLIISKPHISVTEVIIGSEDLILGSDGLWDHMPLRHLESVLYEKFTFDADELVRSAKETFESDDNICCLVISF